MLATDPPSLRYGGLYGTVVLVAVGSRKKASEGANMSSTSAREMPWSESPKKPTCSACVAELGRDLVNAVGEVFSARSTWRRARMNHTN